MTIAVGFQGQEGIVLCADSQETISGYIKLDHSKVHLQLSAPNRAIAIAGAGTSDYIDSAIEKALHEVPDTESLAQVRAHLETKLIEFFDNHLSRWSNFGEQERPTVELLIAVSLLKEFGLFHYSGTIFHKIDSKAIGAGVLLANDLIRKSYSPGQSCEVLAKTATYILWKVKKSVDTCGGFTELVLIKKNGTVAFLDTPSSEALERSYAQIEKESNKRLLADIQNEQLPTLLWHNRESVIAADKSKD